ncbi:hypothetical protein [uncultured Sneathia sp.]|uniref:hypothetical protein n=1 Tax=uncultured Sneathia sp. TaxID=278067 RepID=UPI0025980929|nr:hypothetical protein [uncultured Sneathia sp.]
MKKTLLLTSLVASMVAMAGTTGSVEGYNENEATFVKGAKPTFVAKKTGVKTEVKVEGTGFSFGGEFKAEDLELGNVTKANYLNHSSVWAKYELPEIKGVKSYVKATVSPKFESHLSYEKVPTAESLNAVESEVNKLVNGITDVQKAKEKLAKEAEKEGFTLVAKSIKNSKAKKIDNLKSLLVNAKKSKIQQNIDAATKSNKTPKYIDKGSAELEGQVSYKYNGFTFGLNSKTNFPLNNEEYTYENDSYILSSVKDYGKLVKSTHKLFVESEEDKDVFVKGLKDVKANVEVKHDYRKIEKDHKASEAVEYVSGEVSAKYDAVKDLELEGKVAFKKNVSGEKIGDYEVLGTKLFEEGPARYIHSYELKGTYKGVKHLTLSAKPFVAHVNIAKDKQSRVDKVLYGVELDAEYKMLNDKLTLTGKSLLAGVHDRKIDETKTNTGVFVFDANAKYDYSVTDKFTVSPEANANLELLVSKKVDKLVTEPTLTLTPKVSAEYKPTDTLTLKGSVETPVKFKVVGKEFKYTDTQVKTSLNLKYEWK